MVLTETQKLIVRCLAQGMQSKEIAPVIGRSKATVECNIRMLFNLTGAKSRAHLVVMALRARIIDMSLEDTA